MAAGVNGVFYLAWRYLRWHRWKTAILIGAVALVLYLPLALQVVIEQSESFLEALGEPYIEGDIE